MNVMQQPGPDLFYGTGPGPPSQMVRLFLIFTYIWLEDLAKIPKVLTDPARCKSGLAITWLVGEPSTVPFFNNNSVIHLHLASFYAQNTFKKINHGKC